jgi:BMFP domain-containing protein YqiC
VVAGLNSDMNSATLEILKMHEKLEEAHARIAELEAQLEGMEPPEVEVPISALSPPRK